MADDDALYGIDVRGIEGVMSRLDAAADAVDVNRILEEGGAILLNRIKRRYLQQVDSEGVPWPPSQAAIDRAQSGRDGGTLFDTGALFQSIASARTGPDEVTIATDVPYGVYHNDPAPDSVLPRREFLAFGREDERVIEALVTQRLAGI